MTPMTISPASTPACASPWAQRSLVWGLGTLLSGLLIGCSSPPPAPSTSSPPPGSAPRAAALPYNPVRNDLAVFAMSLLDTRYATGGRGPATGLDCSGLVAHVYKEGAGLPVKGSAADLGRQSRPIEREQLQPGDLVFFNTLGTRHSHVGVYVGGDRFVHASNPRTGVRVDSLNNRYYAQRFEGAHSLLD